MLKKPASKSANPERNPPTRVATPPDPSARSALLALPADAPHRDRLARLLATADAAGVVNEARRLGRLVSAAANSETEDA